MPALLRRRVSSIGQLALRAARSVTCNAEPRFVFASRHGEFARTLSLLDAAIAGEALSPADFSLSVHNALAGLLSIAEQNRAAHTAIASGADTFAAALVECAGMLAAEPQQPVLLVYFDEPLPEAYAQLENSEPAVLALALLLTTTGDGPTIGCEILARKSREAVRSATGQALQFLRFLLEPLDVADLVGPRLVWRWRRVPAC